mgnify:CR=1 FL=1
MFLSFVEQLRAAGLAVGPKEHLALLEALDAGAFVVREDGVRAQGEHPGHGVARERFHLEVGADERGERVEIAQVCDVRGRFTDLVRERLQRCVVAIDERETKPRRRCRSRSSTL